MPSIAAPHSNRFRDVVDVDVYVSDTLAMLGLPIDPRDAEWLMRAGVATVARLELAMPPERPLRPVLDSLLPERLLGLWHERVAAPAVPQAA